MHFILKIVEVARFYTTPTAQPWLFRGFTSYKEHIQKRIFE